MTIPNVGQSLQVFVCSRIGTGLDLERAIVAKAVDRMGLARAWLWERDGFGGPSEEQLCTAAARASDLLVLLLGSDVSPVVKAEFQAAYDAKAHCLVFAKNGLAPDATCRQFLADLASRAILPRKFQNASELRTYLVQALRGLLVEALREARHRRRRR